MAGTSARASQVGDLERPRRGPLGEHSDNRVVADVFDVASASAAGDLEHVLDELPDSVIGRFWTGAYRYSCAV